MAIRSVAACENAGSGKQVHDEWTSIRRLIVKKSSLMLMPFKQLWARMLSMFTAQFPLILRVVAIAIHDLHY